ncbi:MAG: YciI family protein, partial [Acidobacteriia bacterium]|nr:YciI family protein [Terriglobia bacterium]
SETKEVFGGYYLIEAADYDEAVQRALTHPHLEYGGTVEVRKLFEM